MRATALELTKTKPMDIQVFWLGMQLATNGTNWNITYIVYVIDERSKERAYS